MFFFLEALASNRMTIGWCSNLANSMRKSRKAMEWPAAEILHASVSDGEGPHSLAAIQDLKEGLRILFLVDFPKQKTSNRRQHIAAQTP